MNPYIDHTVFPDRKELLELPEKFLSEVDKADYVERICAAWDFDLRPESQTVQLFRQWKGVFDAYPLPQSPAYHAFRTLFGWEAFPRFGGRHTKLTHRSFDAAEERDDPFEDRI